MTQRKRRIFCDMDGTIAEWQEKAAWTICIAKSISFVHGWFSSVYS